MTTPITVTFLRDLDHGGSPGQLQSVAQSLAAFAERATASIEVAIYDFRLADPTAAATVVDALSNAAHRAVIVRIGYDAGKPADGTAADFAALQADPAPTGTQDWVTSHFAGTGVQLKAINAHSQLMHSKYVVRDAATTSGGSPESSAVWTGSTNFTDDAWTRQENNIITVADQAMAAAYRADFDQMWATGGITGTGFDLAGSDQLPTTDTDGISTIGWDFCPGDGPAVNTALADRTAAARDRLVVAAMVLTSHQVLAALAAAIDRGVEVSGIYDAGQMDPIIAQWRQRPADAAVLADWTKVSAQLAAKHSTPYTPTGPHDFMHLKVLLADDTVVTGSYNFSANAERNAENQIRLDDADTVTAYLDYLTAVSAGYTSTS